MHIINKLIHWLASYANSVLQALYFCGPFRDLLIQSQDSSIPSSSLEPPTSSLNSSRPPVPVRKPSSSSTPTNGVSTPNGLTNEANHSATSIPSSPISLFSALRSLFMHISSNPLDKGTVAPRAFIEKLREVNQVFRPAMHQDAHEFFNYLLNKIVEEIEDERKKQNGVLSMEDLSNSVATLESGTTSTSANSSRGVLRSATLVHNLFEGTLTSETRCLTCETASSRDESFIDLSIDIEQNSSVTACLRQFSASEMLCHKNKFFCDACCDLQEAEKRMKIKKLPNILALHLKRFKFQEDLQRYIKLAYRVAFPFQLRLFNTVDDAEDADRLYNLFAIVVHIGTGPHHGHYISIIKTAGTWLVFDDDNVYPIQESDIPKYYGESNSGSAYVLFYEAADVDRAALGLRIPPVPPMSTVPVASAEPVPPSPQTNPTLPPGLTEEQDSSDFSDPAYPLTPSQSSPLLSPDDNKSVPKLPLVAGEVTVASPSGSSPAAGPGRNAQKSLWRRPSAKPELIITSERTAAGLAAAGLDVDGKAPRTPSPSTAQPPQPEMKDKDREKEREMKDKDSDRKSGGGWFGVNRKRSLKTTTDKLKDALPDLPASPVSSPRDNQTASSSSTSSSNWFKSAPTKRNRKPSYDTPMFDAAVFAQVGRPRSTASDASLSANQHRRGSTLYDSPPGSATSSIGSTNLDYLATLPSQSPSAVVQHPPPRKSSLNSPGTPVSAPKPSLKSPDHKKSLATLPRRDSHKRAATDNPPRPSTAPSSAEPVSSRPLPPVPPLPFSLTNGQAVNQGDMMAEASTSNVRDGASRPLSSNGVPPGLASFSGANLSSSTTSSSSGPIKRATRKLSMSSPMLSFGFGKKKEKEDKVPSSSYHSTPIS
ncbi:hypothetical protein D9758_000494 [Tetrapyrgos nigripes]|uniref:ubiquitinyl hydrolase 1 n=1 Tax=Tetrapyrgos nigripes TaxID=182062 RepID=A0A8H5H192_9AGAR|nr:hypothetical protein D9758_000494 [Tetrapyrgos nigripes]